MTERTLDQRIAEAEAKASRLKSQKRAQETGTKIVVGGAVLALARTDPNFASALLRCLGAVNRPADLNRITDVIEELRTITGTPAPVVASVTDPVTDPGSNLAQGSYPQD